MKLNPPSNSTDAAYLLDASALLALLADEPGSEIVIQALKQRCLMCSVNAAEVAGKLYESGVPDAEIDALFDQLLIEIIPFQREDALTAGRLRPETRSAGLSLGDRACLAAAERLSLPVLTADSAWTGIAGSVKVHLVR